MNIRQAILLAADSIEQNPKLFDFGSCTRPDQGCGSPGCALGWIGFHADMPFEAEGNWRGCFVNGLDDIADLTTHDHDSKTFYERMNNFGIGWMDDAGECASTLRQYADKYHPVKHERFHQALIPADSGYNWNAEVVLCTTPEITQE